MTKIYCDIADKSLIEKFNRKKIVKGFTTNPSLMRKAGAKNYEYYCKQILKITNKPISFEKVILLNGYLPTTHQGIADSIRRLDISIPILKIVGVKDVDFYQLGEELHKELKLHGKNPNLVELYRDDNLYHYPVTSGLSGFNRLVNFIQN